jgi:hypothetical protein
MTTEEPTLLQKLDGAIQEHVNANALVAHRHPLHTLSVPLTLLEIQSLAEMLREDEPPDTTGVVVGGYAVTMSPSIPTPSAFSVTGEGIHNRHDIPIFEREADAHSMCRCLGLAYRAGQRERSRAILNLLQPPHR